MGNYNPLPDDIIGRIFTETEKYHEAIKKDRTFAEVRRIRLKIKTLVKMLERRLDESNLPLRVPRSRTNHNQ